MRKSFFAMAAVLGLTAFSAVSCGDDDNNSGVGGTTPPTDIVSYKIKYTVKLTDPNIMEAADVLVEYLDTDGKTQKDTVKEAQWTKEVSLMKGKKVNYGLEARLFAKQNPELTKDTYNFDIDISSPMFNVYNNGENYFSANIRSHGHGGILSDNVNNTIVSKDFVSSVAGRDSINRTRAYFCITETPDSVIRHEFKWE